MYSSDLLINSQTMAKGICRCRECHMQFNAPHLLAKHREKFCVGGTGDPDGLLLRRGLWSGDSPRRDSPDDRPIADTELVESKDEYRRYNPNQDQQLRYLAENHGRQMEYLQQCNKDLEKQRDDIRKRLEGLNKRPVPSGRDSTSDLLRELKEQEERNQRRVEELRREFYRLNNQKVNVIEVEKPIYPMPIQAPPQPLPPPPPPPPQPEPPKKTIVFPLFHTGTLTAEIAAIRQSYLQNGGNDPDVLAQLAAMQAEAQAIEDQMKQAQPQKPKEKPNDNMAQFKLLEMENERLIRELQIFQEQNSMAQNRRKSDKEGKYRSHVRSRHSDHKQLKHSDNYAKPKTPSEIDVKSNSAKTVSLVPDEELIEEIERDAEVMSTKSYHSESAKKPRQKVIYYKAYHLLNGGFHVEKTPNSEVRFEQQFGKQVNRNISTRKPTKVPPLDLRQISSPSDQRYHLAVKTRKNKENYMKRSSSDNLPSQAHYSTQNITAGWDNFPVVQNPRSLYTPQLTKSKSILGYHGIIDPNEYTFYKSASDREEPYRQKTTRVRAPRYYKPSVKPGLPRQPMDKNSSHDVGLDNFEENEGQNGQVYEFQQNDTAQNPQGMNVQQQPNVSNDDMSQQQLPNGTEVSQQQLLPSSMIGKSDDNDVIEYTPAGSPIIEESDDDLSFNLPDDEKYDY